MLTGLRGVGKTVLLVEFETLADSRGYFHEHIEVSEEGVLAPELVGRSGGCCSPWTQSAASVSEFEERSAY
jgi:predicted ATPase